MLCIAAFIVFLILGIFSAYYRRLAAKAWYCVGRRLTFRPCDINFSQEIKGKIIGKMILTKPRLAKFIGKWIDWIAFVFVVLTIWSLLSVLVGGLNLFVYDTCTPSAPESCSLGGESCGINTTELSITDAIRLNKLGEWVTQPFTSFADTVSRIPARFQTWNAADYVAPTGTYYLPFDSAKITAVEAIDPGCLYCKKLFGNIKTAGFEQTHNLTYLLYPIPDTTTPSGTKFKYSTQVASYIEATKMVPLSATGSKISADWQVLEYLFTDNAGKDENLQYRMNNVFTPEQMTSTLSKILLSIGYTPAEVEKIAQLASSPEVQTALAAQRTIVDNKMRTLKIPTIIFDGRRYDRVVDVDTLKRK